MTIDEAIDRINEVKLILKARHMCRTADDDFDKAEINEYREQWDSLDMAINALEKQKQ